MGLIKHGSPRRDGQHVVDRNGGSLIPTELMDIECQSVLETREFPVRRLDLQQNALTRTPREALQSYVFSVHGPPQLATWERVGEVPLDQCSSVFSGMGRTTHGHMILVCFAPLPQGSLKVETNRLDSDPFSAESRRSITPAELEKILGHGDVSAMMVPSSSNSKSATPADSAQISASFGSRPRRKPPPSKRSKDAIPKIACTTGRPVTTPSILT